MRNITDLPKPAVRGDDFFANVSMSRTLYAPSANASPALCFSFISEVKRFNQSSKERAKQDTLNPTVSISEQLRGLKHVGRVIHGDAGASLCVEAPRLEHFFYLGRYVSSRECQVERGTLEIERSELAVVETADCERNEHLLVAGRPDVR